MWKGKILVEKCSMHRIYKHIYRTLFGKREGTKRVQKSWLISESTDGTDFKETRVWICNLTTLPQERKRYGALDTL
jgi:hypothetical protein